MSEEDVRNAMFGKIEDEFEKTNANSDVPKYYTKEQMADMEKKADYLHAKATAAYMIADASSKLVPRSHGQRRDVGRRIGTRGHRARARRSWLGHHVVHRHADREVCRH
jgi:ribosomal protein L19E